MDKLTSSKLSDSKLSQEELKIVELLRHLGDGAPSFFKDACFAIKNTPPLETTSHLVGHCLREIESSMRSIALPADFQGDPDDKKAHKSQITAIIESFELKKEQAEELQELWFEFTDLAEKAHRDSLGPPRPFDTEFKEYFDNFSQLVKSIIPQIISHYDNSLVIAEKLLKKSNPSKKDIKAFKNRLPNNTNTLIDFFQRLSHSDWLIKLEKVGYFDESVSHYHHSPNPSNLWPPYLFLKSMSSKTNCQNLIGEICLRIETDNQALANQLTEIVMELPIETQVTFSKKCIQWLDNVQRWHYPLEFQKLLTSLSSAGKVDEALELAKAMLKLSPPPENEDGKSEFKLPDKPESKIDIHNYEETIEEVLKSGSAGTLEMLDLFCDLLQQSIEISLTKPEEQGDDDLSEIWRSAIENHSQNHGHYSPKDVLAEAVRDLAESLLKNNKTTVGEIIGILKKHHWKVFDRIALHLIRIQLPASLDQAKKYLLDLEYWDQNANLHEFYELAGKAFPLLQAKEKRVILDWIDSGITQEQASLFLKEREVEVTSENIEKAIKSWKRKRYYPIKEVLPNKLSEVVGKLDKDLGGPIKYPGFRSYSHGGSWGPKSPLTVEQLNEMTGDEVFEFLDNWIPDPEDILISPSPEGLGRNLIASIEATGFEKYSLLINKFIKLNPTYVRAFISGFAKTVDKRISKEWENILSLAEKIIFDPPEFKAIGKRPFESDADWTWTYSEIIELISSGFRSESNPPSQKFRKQFWAIISKLVDYPDAQKDENDKQEDTDYIGVAINSAAGRAFEAVIRYGHWVISSDEREKDRIELIPEVANTLEEHLDPSKEQRLAIHSLYGEWLDWLIWYDKKWFRTIKDKIFPANDSKKFSVAWSTYVSYRGPRKTTLGLIGGVYRQAILNLDSTSDTDDHAVDNLVQHLMLFYWHGDLDLDSELLQLFFENANPRLRMRALEVLGRFLCDPQSTFNDEIKERLLKLWESRKNAGNATELEGFGGWFASHRFEDGWRVAELVLALEISKRAEPDHKVMDELAELVENHPFQVLQAASLMIDGVKEYWEISSWGQELTIILDAVKDSQDKGIIKVKKEVASKLCAKGHNTYREYAI